MQVRIVESKKESWTAKYHLGNKHLEIGMGPGNGFHWRNNQHKTVLEGNKLDLDWIFTDIGVINVSHASQRNLILDVHTKAWQMSAAPARTSAASWRGIKQTNQS